MRPACEFRRLVVSHGDANHKSEAKSRSATTAAIAYRRISPLMDEDYARLSIYAGYFAAAADHALGRVHFAPIIRAQASELTWEKLEKLKEEAIAMGIPKEKLEPTQEHLTRFGERLTRFGKFIPIGQKLQKDIDAGIASLKKKLH